jgi:translation elongation factor P/translation initiation factor 5A
MLSVGPSKHHTRVRIEVKKLTSGTNANGTSKAIDGLELVK